MNSLSTKQATVTSAPSVAAYVPAGDEDTPPDEQQQSSSFQVLLSIVQLGGRKDCEAKASYEQQRCEAVEYIHLTRRKLRTEDCRGRYILFIRPKDRLLPGACKQLQDCLRNAYDCVFLTSYADEACTRLQQPLAGEAYLNPPSIENSLRYMALTPCCKLLRRDFFPPIARPEDMVVAALLYSSVFYTLSEPQLVHKSRPGENGAPFRAGAPGILSFSAYAKLAEVYAESVHRVVPEDQRQDKCSPLAMRLHYDACAHATTCSRLTQSLLRKKLRSRARRMKELCGVENWLRAKDNAPSQFESNCHRLLFYKEHTKQLLRMQEEVRKKPIIHVLFIVINIACFKVESLLQAMLRHPRFKACVLVVPELQLESTNARREQMRATRLYMEQHGYPVMELCDADGVGETNDEGEACGIPEEYDILLYPKPYPGIVPKQLDIGKHTDRLWLSINYAFHTMGTNWFYKAFYQLAAWMDCYENESCASMAAFYKQNLGGIPNGVVTGLPISDPFLSDGQPSASVWKPQPAAVKKVIWAPHWTITPELSPLYLSHFLQLADTISELAYQTEGKIQWAFKPHPLLYNSLCNNPDWGQERTDAYYARWAEGANTQLETGDYVELFRQSDAMVHDSCSFCCEYHFTGNPVLFFPRQLESQLCDFSAMTRESVMAQYFGYVKEDVEKFIHNTVLGGHDPMRPRREAFRHDYLIPPHGRSAAENIIDCILTGSPHTVPSA